jgi:chromosome segregation ATPase
MDQPHMASQLEYLEQRHQEDQAKIARLQQQAEAQTYELQQQALRLLKLEEELTVARLALTRIPQLDDRIDHLKNELVQLLDDHFERRAQPAMTAGHGLSSQLDNHTKALNELRREVEKTRRYDEQILLARTEVERLNKVVSTFESRFQTLNKQIEERARSVGYLEEQRRADAQRMVELQSEFPEVQKKVEAGLAKLKTVEQQIPQFGKYEVALEDVREEIRRHREHMDFQMAQRERLMKNWTELAETQEQRMKDNEKLMEKYVEHYQLNRRALASLQDFQEQLQREQHQTEELQRLAENRQRAMLEKIQAEYEGRWQKQGLEWQPQILSLQKDMAAVKEQFNELKKYDQTIKQQLEMILQILEEDIQARASATQEWQYRFEELAGGRS